MSIFIHSNPELSHPAMLSLKEKNILNVDRMHVLDHIASKITYILLV